MRTIIETLSEHAPTQSDPYELTSVIRVALGRAITQQWFPGEGEIQVNHALRPLLARFLHRSLPQLVVLSNMEISDNRQIRMTSTIGSA